jgi:hypothetical protein
VAFALFLQPTKQTKQLKPWALDTTIVAEAPMTGQIVADGSNRFILSSHAVAGSYLVDHAEWRGWKPRSAFVRLHRELAERANQLFSLILTANVLDKDCPEWYTWMN